MKDEIGDNSSFEAQKVSVPDSSEPPSILVCEDESLIRIYLVELLEELGYRVLEAANGSSAIEQLSKVEVDLLITDLGLPDMSGLTLAGRLRDRWPRLLVLFATGRERDNSVVADGRTGYLAKPFTMHTLQAAVSELLVQRKPNGN